MFTMSETSNFICINCGNSVKELYKKYSPTVLKLTTCPSCELFADKYIEYDPIIIIIDLVLLSREAYRHILYNTKYSIHWKLSIILELMEAYSELTLTSHNKNMENSKPIILDNFYTGDLEYYKTFTKVITRNVCFLLVIFLLTLIRTRILNSKVKSKEIFFEVWKCISLSSFGIFLFLPSLIWDKYIVQEYHFIFVSLYTILSQLVAYTVVCKCSKLWAIFVIVTAYVCKIICFDVLSNKLYN